MNVYKLIVINNAQMKWNHVIIVFQGCTGCKSPPSVPAAPFDVEIHEMELCSVLKSQEEEGADKDKKNLSETAMDETHHEDEEVEEEEVEEKGSKTPEEDMAATTTAEDV